MGDKYLLMCEVAPNKWRKLKIIDFRRGSDMMGRMYEKTKMHFRMVLLEYFQPYVTPVRGFE